jgi:hypothetical protein
MASFNLTLEERRAICTFMSEVKVLTGFTANPKKLVSMKDLSFTHCKAHDCHVMLTVFLPIAHQGYKARVLEDGHHLHVLLLFEDLVVETQNQLELCLPSDFLI